MAAQQWWIIWRTDAKGDLAGTLVQSAAEPKLPAGADDISGPGTKAQMQQVLKELGGQPTGGSTLPTPGSVLGSVTGLTGVSDFFTALGKWSLWKRVLEVVFGGVLLLGGIFHLTGAKKTVIELAGTALKAGAVAA
jgi:hypothetical protein